MGCRTTPITSKEKTMHAILYAVGAYLVGVFTPAVSRKIKSYFSKEGKAAVAAVKSEAVAVEKKL